MKISHAVVCNSCGVELKDKPPSEHIKQHGISVSNDEVGKQFFTITHKWEWE